MKIKRWLSLLTAIAVLLGATMSSFSAAAYELSYSLEGLRYDFHSYGQITGYAGTVSTLTIPAEIDGVPIEYINSLQLLESGVCPERLVISEGVRAIGALFGQDSAALREVVLPNTLKILGGGINSYSQPGVFACATSLTTLTVPYSVSLIVENAFHKDLLLRVEAGSYAERWAKANGQPYEIIQHAPSVGDYDANGRCTTTDARLLLQRAVGKVTFTPEQLAAADVDGDGKITTTDARLTLQHAVKKETVETITCPLTFDSPLIPREAAASVVGDIMAACSEGEDQNGCLFLGYKYTRAPGPLKNPMKMVDYLNARIAQEYHSQHKPAIKGAVAGASLTVTIGDERLRMDYRLSYYGISTSVTLSSEFNRLIME